MVDFAHHVPGRLRIQASHLKRNAAAIAVLRADLLNIDGVTSVSANQATGSITIFYDSRGLDPIVIWKTIQRLGYLDRNAAYDKPAASPVTEKLISAAADQFTKAAIDFALERLVGRPAATLIGALI